MSTEGPAEGTSSPPPLSALEKQMLLGLARRTLVDFLEKGACDPDLPDVAALRRHRAAFVTLTRRDSGDLRGCRGECLARQPLAASVAQMAIASAADDPRFPPVELAELPELDIEISALTELAPVRPADIVVGRHGLMIVTRHATGLLLPQTAVAYGWNREEFLTWLCRKARLPDGAWLDDDAQLYAFEAETMSESGT